MIKNIIQFNKMIPLVLLLGVITMSFVSNKANVKTKLSATEQKMMFLVSNMSKEDIKALSPSSFEKLIGHELSWKETIALKKVKKYMSEEASDTSADAGSKSQGVAFLLCLFIGYLGVHRFYLGHTGTAILQLITAGGCGIWALIDLIRIIMNTLPDANGNTLTNWFD